MYTVYVIEGKDNKLYKGMTSDLQRRLKEHKRGHTYTTRKMSELKVVYTEEFIDWKSARARELYMKSAAGRKFLKKILPR